jgi:hypothetical protein
MEASRVHFAQGSTRQMRGTIPYQRADQRAARVLTHVIAKREALWRSRPAGLDCRAPAGLAMTMTGALVR